MRSREWVDKKRIIHKPKLGPSSVEEVWEKRRNWPCRLGKGWWLEETADNSAVLEAK